MLQQRVLQFPDRDAFVFERDALQTEPSARETEPSARETEPSARETGTNSHPTGPNAHRQAWTYGELDRRSQRIAAWLVTQTNPGDRVFIGLSTRTRIHCRFYRVCLCGSLARPGNLSQVAAADGAGR